MASVFTHAIIPLCAGVALGRSQVSPRLIFLGMLVAALPDADVLGFSFGVNYHSSLGHRGFMHSLPMAAMIAFWCMVFARILNAKKITVFFFAFFSMASHGLLDACTTGGLGVEFFWPWDTQRYFLPWHFIRVSPIGKSFFSERGWVVIQSELINVWLPLFILGLSVYFLRKQIKWKTEK